MTLFPWVDIVMILTIGAGIYFGRKSQLLSELFRLVGMILATFISLHYYVSLAKVLNDYHIVPPAFTNIFAFCFLIFVILAIFAMLCEGWLMIFDIELDPLVNQWGGLVFSLIRTYFICGLMFVGLLVIGYGPITEHAKQSASRFLFQNTSVGLYKGFYYGFVQALFPKEHINQEVVQLVSDQKEKKEAESSGEDNNHGPDS